MKTLRILLPFLLIACSNAGQEGTPGDARKLSFQVEESLLGADLRLEEQQLLLFAPLDWSPVGEDLLTRLRAAQDEGAKMNLLQACFHPASSSMLSISVMHHGDVPAVERLRSDLEGREGLKVSEDSYRLNGMPCTQFLAEDSLLVQFRLLLRDSLLVDYLVPRNAYTAQLKALESSIGSIVPLQ